MFIIKKNKRIKKNFLKKKKFFKKNLIFIISKSLKQNKKILFIKKIYLIKQKNWKKKNSSIWLNNCFFSGLYKQMWHKVNISRFFVKYLNQSNKISSLTLKK